MSIIVQRRSSSFHSDIMRKVSDWEYVRGNEESKALCQMLGAGFGRGTVAGLQINFFSAFYHRHQTQAK